MLLQNELKRFAFKSGFSWSLEVIKRVAIKSNFCNYQKTLVLDFQSDICVLSLFLKQQQSTHEKYFEKLNDQKLISFKNYLNKTNETFKVHQ